MPPRPHPVAIIGRWRVKLAVGHAQYLQELARAIALVLGTVGAQDEDRVGNRERLGRGQGFNVAYSPGRGRGKREPKFRPGTPDDSVGHGARRFEIIAKRGQILEIQDIAEIGAFELEIEKTAVQAALNCLDAPHRFQGVAVLAEGVEVARQMRDKRRRGGSEARYHPDRARAFLAHRDFDVERPEGA